jgi:hypothetical protein
MPDELGRPSAGDAVPELLSEPDASGPTLLQNDGRIPRSHSNNLKKLIHFPTDKQ